MRKCLDRNHPLSIGLFIYSLPLCRVVYQASAGWPFRLCQTSRCHQNKSSVLVWDICTKKQPLLWSQWEVCHNLNGNPVDSFNAICKSHHIWNQSCHYPTYPACLLRLDISAGSRNLGTIFFENPVNYLNGWNGSPGPLREGEDFDWRLVPPQELEAAPRPHQHLWTNMRPILHLEMDEFDIKCISDYKIDEGGKFIH